MHKASRILLELGLHLNVSKTKLFGKKEFREYRALEFLRVASLNNEKKVVSELKKIKQLIHSGKPVRFDTVFSRTLTYVEKNKSNNLVLREFLTTNSKEYTTLRMLTSDQFLKLISISDDPSKTFKFIYCELVKFPYANPKAEFLRMIWKSKNKLSQLGVSKRKMEACVSKIKSNSKDSVVLLDICIPKAETSLSNLS